jgi:hypothetical protein
MSNYIIDVGEGYIRHGLERTLAIPVRINEHEDHWMDTRIPVTPYTAPDLEQVRKEAYDKGYDDAKYGYENGFENGMIVAWDAARKIGNMPYDEEEKVFGSGGWAFIEKHTAAEAIEKLKAYEQEQETDGLRQNIQTIVDQCGYSLDEIAAVLDKMREGQDG